MSNPLDDLLIIVEWLSASKTPPPNVALAFERLRNRLLMDRVKPAVATSLHVPLPDPLDPLLHEPSNDTA